MKNDSFLSRFLEMHANNNHNHHCLKLLNLAHKIANYLRYGSTKNKSREFITADYHCIGGEETENATNESKQEDELSLITVISMPVFVQRN